MGSIIVIEYSVIAIKGTVLGNSLYSVSIIMVADPKQVVS